MSSTHMQMLHQDSTSFVPQPSSILLLLLLFFLSLFLLKWLSTPAIPSQKNPPPSPPKLPIIGHLHQLGSHPHRSLLSLARLHGPIMLLRLGCAPAVVVSSPAAAKEIMKIHDLVFANRPVVKVNRKLLYDLKDVSVAPYGEYWRQLKSICVLQLLSSKKVQSYRSIREEETRLMMEKIEESGGNVPVNLSEMFSSIANDVVCRAAFGRKYCKEGERGNRFRGLVREFLGLLGSANVEDFLPWLAWINRFNGRDALVDRVAKGLDEFLEEVLEERMREGGDHRREDDADVVDGESREDFADILLRIHRSNDAGVSIDRDSVKAIILDVFSAGTDTTSSVLEWAMTELLRHPRIMKELQKEMRELGLAKGKSIVSEDDLEKMPYLKAVIKETLRYHTPIPLLVPREASHDVEVMGYDIAAGTMVIINAWAIGRDPSSWDEPEEFKPERFLNSSIDYKGHDFELIPFGAGRRGCPGIAFATITNELVLANLMNKFDWQLPDGKRGEDLDTTECTGVTVHREIPLLAVATSCSP